MFSNNYMCIEIVTAIGPASFKYGDLTSKYSESNSHAQKLHQGNLLLQSKLVTAAYSSSSWNSLKCVENSFKIFEVASNKIFVWPLEVDSICEYINWCHFEKGLSASTIKSYISNLATIHKLKNLSAENFLSFLVKTHLRGVENLNLVSGCNNRTRRVMTLPVLKILGHEIAGKIWTANSKQVVWTAMCVAFFGSFRIGEILAKAEFSFNYSETLLWKDIKFFEDNSVQIFSRVTKNRTPGGENISLFEFTGPCCPVSALRILYNNSPKCKDLPVFRFNSGKLLTQKSFNIIIQNSLYPHFGKTAENFSGHSFRAGLPSALSGCQGIDSVAAIKQWGRWNSDAYKRYTKLDHSAKKKVFKMFKSALENQL
jgi:hypothetical protein